MLVRTWNLFHGNTKPPSRRAFLEAAVRLAVADAPDVVCLQELPAWSLPKLAAWSGYSVMPALADPPSIGPLPSTPSIGRALTSIHPGVLRSAFSGQGNAVLAAPGLELREQQVCVLNPSGFRRAQARWLRLGLAARVAWAKEGRVCQVVRLADGVRTFIVANLHATSYPPDERLADAELLRAFVYVDALAEPEEGIAVAGDFNVTSARSRTLLDLSGEEWGFSRPGQGIDHVLVRNLRIVDGPTRWPVERRARGFATLSDHTPVDVTVE
jgi:endonuclease/exonuclease/phosphatase family metal-dependent hydrolase